jgi:hypothetical protein
MFVRLYLELANVYDLPAVLSRAVAIVPNRDIIAAQNVVRSVDNDKLKIPSLQICFGFHEVLSFPHETR